MIGRDGERGSGISAQAARHDDDDENWFEKLARSEMMIIINHWEFCKKF